MLSSLPVRRQLNIVLALLLGVAMVVTPLASTAAHAAPNDTVTMNPSGGNTASDGLRIAYKSTGFQVFREGKGQFFYETSIPGSMGWYLARPGVSGTHQFTSSATPVLSNSGTTLTNTLTTTDNGVVYTLTVIIDYVSPAQNFRVRATLTPGSGSLPSNLIVYWGNDAYLGGLDSGYSYTAVRGGNREVGVSASNSGSGATEWTRYASGPAWTGYFAGHYTQYYNKPSLGQQYDGISASYEDNGFGWSSTVDPSTNPTFDYYIGFSDSLPSPGATPPSTPRNVTVAQEPDNDVVVTWDPPTSDGGSPVESYEVELRNASGEVVGRTGTGPSGNSATFPGLPPGEYTATVSASNAIGSSSSVPQAPQPPGRPTNVAAIAGDRAITVSWTPPSDDGGSPITQYTATTSAGQSCTTATTSCTITGLENGTPYTVSVVATNDAGSSEPTNPTEPVTPTPTPDPNPTPNPDPTPSPDPSPSPDPDPTPKPKKKQTNLGVAADESGRIPVDELSTLVRSTRTDGKIVSLKAWCELKGHRLGGRDAAKLCRIDVQRPASARSIAATAKQDARVQVNPQCSVGLTYHVRIKAKKAGQRATTWTRTWRIQKNPAVRCYLAGTG